MTICIQTRSAATEMDAAGARHIHDPQLVEEAVVSPNPAGGDAVDYRVYSGEENVRHKIESARENTRRLKNLVKELDSSDMCW